MRRSQKGLEKSQLLLISVPSLTATDPWLIYALGGGWGHLVRALSLGRIAAIKRPILILCNSPYAQHLLSSWESGNSKNRPTDGPMPFVEGCYLHAISPIASSSATRNQVRQVVGGDRYGCLVVDTFPRGLGGELADLLPDLTATPKILVHRDINPDYASTRDLQRFVTDRFDLAIVPGEGDRTPLAQLSLVRHTAPWLIRSHHELPDVAGARALLGLNSDRQPLVIVCAAGLAEELDLYGELTLRLAESLQGVTVRCLAAERPTHCPAELWAFHWPGMECLPAADVVIGGAGYNTFYECAAVGVPLVAFAFTRQYDRQGMRALRGITGAAGSSVMLVETVEEAIAAVSDFLAETPRKQPRPTFINGAIDAVELIAQIVGDD